MAQALDLDRLLAPDYLDRLGDMPTADLRALKAECNVAESALSYLRRLVQVRLDIILGELHRRATGTTSDVSDIIAQLPDLLSESGGTRTTTGRFAALELPDINHRALTKDLDLIFDINKAGTLSDMDDAAVQGVADALVDLERRVSAQRRGLHERLDALQAELVRRYKSGEANVETLLS